MKTKSLFLAFVFLGMTTALQLNGCGHKSEDQRIAINEAFNKEQQPTTSSVSEETQKGTTQNELAEKDRNSYATDKKTIETPSVDNDQIPQ